MQFGQPPFSRSASSSPKIMQNHFSSDVYKRQIADKAADLDVLADGQHLVGGDVSHGAVSAGIRCV